MAKNQLKHPNVFKVSYPNYTYLRVRDHAYKTGMSIQDIQRKALDEYLTRVEAAEAAKQAAKLAAKQEKPIQGTNPYFAGFNPRVGQLDAVDMFGRTPEEIATGIILPRKQKKP
jgi:hypothetical protein